MLEVQMVSTLIISAYVLEIHEDIKKNQLQWCEDFGFQGHSVDWKDGSDEGGTDGGGIIAGVVGEQEASWLLLSILSLYINTTRWNAVMCRRTLQLTIYTQCVAKSPV